MNDSYCLCPGYTQQHKIFGKKTQQKCMGPDSVGLKQVIKPRFTPTLSQFYCDRGNPEVVG
ncbi:hypothetical protein CHARACLAT_026367 [Characodon lateralis]|uniref:Uncharacterized protein n=1 Tax=Characodon lateralis TaxID=208331 RepID=A0ABU7DUD3_9TELE|nr:hypothetical protein [Characodon lateralis]